MKRKPKYPKKFFLILSLAASLIMGAYILSFETKHRDLFYPGVFVDGKPVGGKTYNDILSKYKTGADSLSENGITLSLEGRKSEDSVNIPMTASGMSSDEVVEYFSLGDWESEIKKAFNYGRSGTFLNKSKEKISLLFKNKVFDLPASFQGEAISSFYIRELQEKLKEASPAEFIYKSNGVTILKEQEGETIKFDEIAKEINTKLSSFDPTPITLKVDNISPITTKEKLTPYLPVAKKIAGGINLSFKYRDYEWNISGKKFITWLKINDEGRLAIDKDKLESFLYKNIIPVLDNPPQNSRFEIINGVITETMPGKSGNMVDIEKTIAKTEEIIFGFKKSLSLTDSFLASLGTLDDNNITIKNGSVIIPIVITESTPRVTKDTLSVYKIKELVGISVTNLKGSSADRIYNIKIGVSKLSGILIPPDGEFSAVASIGPTTEKEGFLKEYVIKDNKSVKESGGGLCQIATTLFRLAINSGLPITERVNHRYVVSYYGPGLDATIYEPHPDLRFVNNTGEYLLLQGKIEGDELIFEFYGQKDGRQVTISEPVISDEKPAPETKYLMSEDVKYATMECTETPRKGLTAEVTYNVQYKDGTIKEQKFKSVYEPWGKICLIGLKK